MMRKWGIEDQGSAVVPRTVYWHEVGPLLLDLAKIVAKRSCGPLDQNDAFNLVKRVEDMRDKT
jgi:hypothetical protein